MTENLYSQIQPLLSPLFQDFSLELKPGQVMALVGPSGEGKSTCVSLLERFYEPQDGEILLDNEPLKSYDHRYLHKKVIKRLVLFSFVETYCLYLLLQFYNIPSIFNNLM